MNYYESELNKIDPSVAVKIVITGDDGSKTNTLNLNQESIAALKRFLDIVEAVAAANDD